MAQIFNHDILSVSSGPVNFVHDTVISSETVLEDVNADIRAALEVTYDVSTDIRAKHTESLNDIDTDIRVAKESLYDISTDIRTRYTESLNDIDTDIRIAKENLEDISTDIRIQFQPVIEDIDADIRAAMQNIEDIHTDIRVYNEVAEDISTDIRAKISITEDINTDIRAVFGEFVDISTDIRARHDIDNTQVQVVRLGIIEGEYLSDTAVTIELEVYGAVKMQFRNENNPNWSSLEAYSPEKSWTLSSGDGDKIVFVRFEDVKGNLSNGLHTVTAVLSTTTAPAVSIEGYDDSAAITPITESVYQLEETPYFRWQVPNFIVPYEGFSYALNGTPGDIVTIPTPDIIRDGIAPSKKTPLPEMTIETTSGNYYFSEDLKGYTSQEITLDDGGSLDRIDLIYVAGSAESLNVIKGDESVSPTVPDLPEEGLPVATAYVPAGATTISSVTLTDIREFYVELPRYENEPLGIGQHTLSVKGIMANGAVSDIDVFNIWVANPSPEMGDLKAHTDNTQTVEIFNGIYQTATDTPFLSWTAAPAEPGPINYHYTLDGSEPTQADPFTTGTTLSLGPLLEGITTIKIKPFDSVTNNFGLTKEFVFVYGTTSFTNDTAVIGGNAVLLQSTQEVQVRSVSWNFDSARVCNFDMPAKLFDDNLPFSEGQLISVVYGASNITVFRGKIKQIERTINIGEEMVSFVCVGPRGDLNECYATITHPDFGDTAQITFDNKPIISAIDTIIDKVPATITSVESYPVGANVSDEYIAQTVAQVLDSIYSRTKYGWYIEPNGTLVSVDASAINPGQAKFGILGTTVNSISPQYNVMSNTLTFDVNKRYNKAIIEGAKRREKVTLSGSCGLNKDTIENLRESGTDTSDAKYKVFQLESKWPIVKLLKTYVSYSRLKSFTLIPTFSDTIGFGSITKFTIVFLETEICRANKGQRMNRNAINKILRPIDAEGNNAIFDMPYTHITKPQIETFEESQGSLGPDNTIRFSKAMYSYWPSGASLNSTYTFETTPGVSLSNSPVAGIPNYFWRNPPKKGCAGVTADVLIETVPIRATVTVPGTANSEKILRIVKTDFIYDEDPDNLRDDTAEMIQYATDALNKHKDIQIRGSIILDTVDLSWNLKKTVNLINTQQGSWTSLNAKVVGISYNFDNDTTTLEITTEFLK